MNGQFYLAVKYGTNEQLQLCPMATSIGLLIKSWFRKFLNKITDLFSKYHMHIHKRVKDKKAWSSTNEYEVEPVQCRMSFIQNAVGL